MAAPAPALYSSSLSSNFPFSHTQFSHFPTYPLLHSPPRLRCLRIVSCLSINQTNNRNVTPETAVVSGGGKPLRVVFAAGGTGGHIYPAIAIADELKSMNPDTQILFLGTPNGMECTAVPAAGYPFAPISSAVANSPNLFILPYNLIKTLIESWRHLNEFNPQIMVGTGGYVSFPICLAAAVKGIKLVIQEQNSVPGTANWVLSVLAKKIFVAFNSTVECFPAATKKKCLVSGIPVRSLLRQYVSKAVARKHFFPRAGKVGDMEGKVVLVLGGSFGANAINIALLNMYSRLFLDHKDWYIIWQTGVQAFDEMESLVRDHPRLMLTPFSHSMDLAYAAADLIVSRAGAMTCGEILATGKPAILIPSPDVAEGHQSNNASLMADLAGSRIITEDELDSTTLRTAMEEILENENLMVEMSERALKAAKPSAAAEVAQHILSLLEISTAT